MKFLRTWSILPHLSAFAGTSASLRGGAVCPDLPATARSLYLPLMARAAGRPVILVVADNKAAEALEPVLKAGCELTGAIDPERVVRLPAHDVLPFENLSPIPMCRSIAPPLCGSWLPVPSPS